MSPTLPTALELVLPPPKLFLVVRHLEDITTLGAQSPTTFIRFLSLIQPTIFPILLSRRQRQFFFFSFTSCAPPKCLHAGRAIRTLFCTGAFFTVTWAGFFRHDFEMLYDFTKERNRKCPYMNRKSKDFYHNSAVFDSVKLNHCDFVNAH